MTRTEVKKALGKRKCEVETGMRNRAKGENGCSKGIKKAKGKKGHPRARKKYSSDSTEFQPKSVVE